RYEAAAMVVDGAAIIENHRRTGSARTGNDSRSRHGHERRVDRPGIADAGFPPRQQNDAVAVAADEPGVADIRVGADDLERVLSYLRGAETGVDPDLPTDCPHRQNRIAERVRAGVGD